jgi:2-oxoglutarate ferredoxin oxidoreductase subunit alpha
MAKRRSKLESYDYGDLWADVEGEGALAVLTFGSCTGPVREALAQRAGTAPALRLVSLRLLAPLQCEKLAAALAGVRRLLVVEQNESGQLLGYLRSAMTLPADTTSLRKPGGQQFNPGEIRDALAAWSKA